MPHSELYRCRGCDFAHRFPSKVRRHFHYRHSVVPPYRCGHCSFRAVERGKVVKHCASAHPTRRLAVLTRDDEDKLTGEAAADTSTDRNTFQRPADGGRRPYDLSSLRNIRKPAVGGGTSKAERARSTPAPSSESLSSKDAANDESGSEDDVESSLDECETPGSSRRAQQDGVIEEEEEDDDDDDMADEPTHEHIPCETIFAINRTTYMQRPVRWPQTPSDRGEDSRSSDARQSSTNLPAATTTTPIKTEPDNDHEYQTAATPEGGSVQAPTPPSAPAAEIRREIPLRAPVTPVGTSGQRHYYCIYCGMTSRWNKRDVRLHVMHVHVGVRAFACGHCGFGNSKSRAVVRTHCSKYHAGREVIIIDNEAMFEAVDAVQEQENLVAMALTSSDGTPLLSLDELDRYCSSKDIKFRSPTAGRKSAEPRARLPDPETVRETIRSTLSQPPQDRPDEEQQPLEASADSSLSSDLITMSDEMEELGCRWKCGQCDFRDSVFEQVESHFVEQHMQLKLFSCPHCHKYFSESEAVLAHIDDSHAGREREVVSTVDEKSNYILRNIECVSVDVEPAASSNRPRQFQTDRTGAVQCQSGDALRDRSTSNDSQLERDTSSVTHEGRGKNIRGLKPAERQRTGEVSATATDSATEERHPSSVSSKNVLGSSEELDEPSSFSYSSAEQDEEATTNKAHGDDDEDARSRLATDENSGRNDTNICTDPTINDVAMTSPVYDAIGDVSPRSAEDRRLLGDSAHGQEQPTSLHDLSVPPVTLAISDNKVNVHAAEHGNADALPTSGEEQESFSHSSRSGERQQQPDDAPVLSITTSCSGADEGSDDDPPTLDEEQHLPRVLARSGEQLKQQFDDVSPLLTPPSDSAGDGGRDQSSLISRAQHNIADALPASTEQPGLSKYVPLSTEQASDILAPSTTPADSCTYEENNEDGKNTVDEKADQGSADHKSVKTSPEERTERLSNSPPQPTRAGTETAAANRNASHGENPHLPSSQVIDGGSFSIIVQLSRPSRSRASAVPQDLPGDPATVVHPPERVVSDLGSRSDGQSRPGSEEREPSNVVTDTSLCDAATQKPDAERHGMAGNPANDGGLSSDDPRPPPAQVDDDNDDDDGAKSDSSSSSSDGATSTWRCDDCSFVTTSETLLVAHQRSRQQYRCLYCPDFRHSSVVHLRHHCLTRHPGKPISYKHTELPCADVKTTAAGKAPASGAGQCANTPTAAQRPKPVETPPHAAITSTSPGNAKTPGPPAAEKSGDGYCLDMEESSNREESSNEESAESDNSQDDDWEEYVPKKKSKTTSKKNKNASKTPPPNDDGPLANTAGAQGTIVCDLCTSYTTSNSTVMRHHVMSHLQYYPYYCPYCTSFRSVRSFPITKHIRMKHPGKAERFECDADAEMETKIRNSSHRVRSGAREHGASTSVEQIQNPAQPVETKAPNSSTLEEREQTVPPPPATAGAAGNKNRRILYKCKLCGLKTHLRGDFRHHIMRELQYKPFK